jgi:hypothetical protein
MRFIKSTRVGDRVRVRPIDEILATLDKMVASRDFRSSLRWPGGAEGAQASYLRELWIRRGVGWAFAVLLVLCVTDVVILAIQLT